MTSTGARLLIWLRRHLALAVAGAVATAFIATMVAVSLHLAEERRLRVDAIAEQTRMNELQADKNEMFNRDLCTGLNEAIGGLRRLLDDTIRLRPPSRPFTDEERQVTLDAYGRLPERNCETGAKTFYAPPFPPTTEGS